MYVLMHPLASPFLKGKYLILLKIYTRNQRYQRLIFSNFLRVLFRQIPLTVLFLGKKMEEKKSIRAVRDNHFRKV